MLKEIALLGAMASLYIQQPNRANETYSKEVLNSTEYEIVMNSEINIEAHTQRTLTASSQAYFTDCYIDIYQDSEPTGVYYWLNQVDNEQEVLMTFTRIQVSGQTKWQADVPSFAEDTFNGIQFFQKVSMVGDTYYIKQPDLSNVNVVNSNLLPQNSSANLHLSNGQMYSIVELRYEKTAMDKGIHAFAQFKVNGLSYICNNSLTGNTPTDSSQVTNMMMYKNNFTNEITFTYGNYARAWNTQGYNKLSGLLTEDYQPYVKYETGNNLGISLVPLTTGVTLVGLSFEALNSLFSYIIFPGLTLGMLLLIPVILGVVFTILRLVKKG